jgi:hypothetical protein
MNFKPFSRTDLFDFRRDPQSTNAPATTPATAAPRPSPPPERAVNRPRSAGLLNNNDTRQRLPRKESHEESLIRQTTDILTLGQAKPNPPEKPPKPKVTWPRSARSINLISAQLFDYRYEDTDTIMNELDEFYPYVEMAQVATGPEDFKGSMKGGMSCSSLIVLAERL